MGRPPASVAPLVMMRVTYDFLNKKKHLQTLLTITLYWGKKHWKIVLCFVNFFVEKKVEILSQPQSSLFFLQKLIWKAPLDSWASLLHMSF